MCVCERERESERERERESASTPRTDILCSFRSPAVRNHRPQRAARSGEASGRLHTTKLNYSSRARRL